MACRVLYRKPRTGCVADPLCRIAAMSLHARARWASHIMACLATRPTAKPPSCHDIITCIVTRLANQTARLSRYKDCIVTQPPAARPSLCHDTKLCIATLTPSQAACARFRPYHEHYESYCGACSAVSWLSPGRIVAYPLRAHACCIMIQSTVS